MNSPEENKAEKPADIYVEKDVLGLEKPAIGQPAVKARPDRIFIALAILAALVLLFWLVKT